MLILNPVRLNNVSQHAFRHGKNASINSHIHLFVQRKLKVDTFREYLLIHFPNKRLLYRESVALFLEVSHIPRFQSHLFQSLFRPTVR